MDVALIPDCSAATSKSTSPSTSESTSTSTSSSTSLTSSLGEILFDKKRAELVDEWVVGRWNGGTVDDGWLVSIG